MSHGLELLTTAEMAEADRSAIDLLATGGAAVAPGFQLMLKAGAAVVVEARRIAPAGSRILVICGPGNNGGDGFVAARHLEDQAQVVRVMMIGDRGALTGDAARASELWDKPALSWKPALIAWADLIIDAMFGAGLSRPITGIAAEVIATINASGKPVLAVDVPSGLDGTTGAATGPVVTATRTVTFFRRKPGHLLLPGRSLCSDIALYDIGIPADVLHDIKPQTFANAPRLWHDCFPSLISDAHKYTRGHAIVVSGPSHATGAARLGARGALRVGAGLVTVASPLASVAANAMHLTAIMIAPFAAPEGLTNLLADKRKNAVLIGPGCGVGAETRRMVEIALASDATVVLDADALTSFTPNKNEVPGLASVGFLGAAQSTINAEPATLVAFIRAKPNRPVVLTPHEGEFKRLFSDLTGSKLDRARAAAERSGAVVVLKGPDTVIAAPDGRAAINENAPPMLATAGSGDVLAGFITGLLAQGMQAFEAACAAVWLHGECANAFGPGLIAEDLPEALPGVLAKHAATPAHENL